MVLATAAVVAALVVVLAVVVARDMDRHGRSGELYAVAILFVLPLGLLMWLLDRRRPLPSEDVAGVPGASPAPRNDPDAP